MSHLDRHDGATAGLAAFASTLGRDDIPDAVVHRLKLHFLDSLGVALACADLAWLDPVHDYTRRFAGPGPAVLLGGAGQRVDPEYAVLVNSTAAHGIEFDDYCSGTFAHPGCIAIPTVLAVGAEQGASGAQALVATAIAYEVIVRLALATMPSMLSERGFHETAAHGVFGAALAAGRLMGLSPDEMVMATAIAGSHASGTSEYAQSGGQVKRLHAGLGSAGGIRSARLAAHGATGPRTIIEGRRGFLHAFSPSPRPEALLDGLGTDWVIAKYLSIKPYCCAASLHPMIDAALAAMDELRAAPEDVESIVIGASRHTLTHVGSIGPEPSDMTSAQFSAHFAVALAIVSGANDIDAYLSAADSGFADPATVGLARKIRLEWDEETEEFLPRGYLGKVLVRTRAGKEGTGRATGRGSPGNPMADSDIERKFLANAGRALSPDSATELRDRVMELEDLDDTDRISLLLPGAMDESKR